MDNLFSYADGFERRSLINDKPLVICKTPPGIMWLVVVIIIMAIIHFFLSIGILYSLNVRNMPDPMLTNAELVDAAVL